MLRHRLAPAGPHDEDAEEEPSHGRREELEEAAERQLPQPEVRPVQPAGEHRPPEAEAELRVPQEAAELRVR